MRAMDEIVWAVNPKNDTLDNLISYLCDFADEYLRAGKNPPANKRAGSASGLASDIRSAAQSFFGDERNPEQHRQTFPGTRSYF